MSSYYSVLKRAIDSLDSHDRVTRQAVYDRARQALADRAHSQNEGVQGADMAAAMSDLEAAIQDIEAEMALQTTPAPVEAPRRASKTPRFGGIGARGRVQWISVAAAGAAALVAIAVLVYVFRPAGNAGAKPDSAVPAPLASAPTQPVDNRSYLLRRQLVYYRSTYPVGTIVISKSQNFLYVTKPNTVAVRYSIGMGPEGKDSLGLYSILRKELEPERAQQSARAKGVSVASTAASHGDSGVDRALFFGEPNYRIHGTDTPSIVGRIVAAGGFQLVGEDIVDLYDRASIGTRVVVTN